MIRGFEFNFCDFDAVCCGVDFRVCGVSLVGFDLVLMLSALVRLLGYFGWAG